MNLDKFDISILGLVQQNNRLTSEELAEKVGLSPTAIQRRLKRLRSDGIIEADIAVISPKALRSKICLIVEIEIEREDSALLKEFKTAMLKSPLVMQCYYVAGKADFVLMIVVKDMLEYESFTQKHFLSNTNIRKFNTQVVLERIKVGLAVPLSES